MPTPLIRARNISTESSTMTSMKISLVAAAFSALDNLARCLVWAAASCRSSGWPPRAPCRVVVCRSRAGLDVSATMQVYALDSGAGY